LNIYYSNIKIIIIFKITTMSIWFILKNLVRTCRECKFCWYWTIEACIHPWQFIFQIKEFLTKYSFPNYFFQNGKISP
jgi:hypothetical protein